MKFTIRPSEKRDEPQIIECQSELQDAESLIDKNRKTGIESAKKYLASIRKEMKGKDGGVFVAELNNEIIGMIIMYVDENEIEDKEGTHIYISDLVVKKSFRNQGIAQKLMAFAEKFARNRAIKDVQLGVLANNKAALNLYEKKGFKMKKISLIKKLK